MGVADSCAKRDQAENQDTEGQRWEVIGSGRECGKGFAMLLPCRRGAAFLQLMVDQRICTCVARSNHFLEEVGTPYFFSKKFLFNALEENSN